MGSMNATVRLVLLVSALSAGQMARAQTQAPPSTNSPSDSSPAADDSPTTMFPHSESSRFWVSGQANIVLQWHPSFAAKYSGPNSFRSQGENATSRTYTLYTGLDLTHSTEILVDVESAGGHGISDALGLAGFTNLDVVRNPDLGATPYLARFLVRQVIPLSHERVAAERGPLGLFTSLPARRLELRFGKFSLVDFFDVNSGGSDSHLQFLNWTMDNNGVYDYAANTRGYTDGAIVEYDDRSWSLRFAEVLMPKVANGIHLDADVTRARSENLETDVRGNRLLHRAGKVRLLGFVNHANMGSYREAIDAFLSGKGARPDITAVRRQGRIKYGFGLNLEQEIPGHVTLFGRLGWSDGRNESFAYTEVDRTIEVGAGLPGNSWKRRNDRVGAAITINALSGDHRRYLALGGVGFLLGDGALTYGREKILEGYYTLHVWRGTFASFDLHRIWNPGYNQDRGPAIVPGLRLHVDF
jgi:high affinity Mn2+ porin